jgi:hypothetical protein
MMDAGGNAVADARARVLHSGRGNDDVVTQTHAPAIDFIERRRINENYSPSASLSSSLSLRAQRNCYTRELRRKGDPLRQSGPFVVHTRVDVKLMHQARSVYISNAKKNK